MNVLVFFITAASLLMLSSLVLLYVRKRLVAQAGVRTYKTQAIPESLSDYILDNLHATGVYLPKQGLHLMMFFFIIIIASLSVLVNIWVGLFLSLFGVAAVMLIIRVRVMSMRDKIVAQMPTFLEQMSRNLSTGQSIEVAFTRLLNQVDFPLQHSVKRIKARRDFGQELYDSVKHEARIIGSFELELLSTILQVNMQYGGAVKQALESFTGMLRQKERSRRELHALTGETRITAWVLSLVPILVLVAVLVANPNYLDPMLESRGGQMSLLLAVLMQVIGVLAIRRMMRIS